MVFIPVTTALWNATDKQAEAVGDHLGYATETSSLVVHIFAISAVKTGSNANET